MVRRRNRTALALSALLAATGCHAGTSGGLTRPTPPPVAKQDVAVAKIVAQHNKNAANIHSIQATPTIHVAGGPRAAKVDGRLAMERPKDFRLQLRSFGNSKADIGSNKDGFWFWVDEDSDKKIYVCDHDQVNASPLAVTLQPDWIVEAMGLREFPPEEARTISSKPDGRPGLIVLTQFRKDAKGQTLTKETVVDETTGQIKEHRLWAGAKQELLASATISSYLVKKIAQAPAADPDNPDAPKANEITVQIPSRFRLKWVKEKFELDIIMDRAMFNTQFPPEQRLALFSEPKIPGVARQDLAMLGNGAAAANSSRMYESMPRPGIGLGQPEPAPIDVEGSMNPAPTPRPLSAENRRPSAASGSPYGTDGVVRAPVPTGSDPGAERASGSNLLNAAPRDQ